MENDVDFEYRDIGEDDQANLQFEKLRNEFSIYDEVKKSGKVGIPTIVIDGTPYINILNDTEKIKRLLGL